MRGLVFLLNRYTEISTTTVKYHQPSTLLIFRITCGSRSTWFQKAESILSRPTIRHPDLQPNNIFVSDSLTIVGLIDWQHCSILPLFLQAGPPKYFQNYGDEESERLTRPQLPEGFDQLSQEEQDVLKDLYRRRQLHYYYIAATARLNKDHFEACTNEHGMLKQKLSSMLVVPGKEIILP